MTAFIATCAVEERGQTCDTPTQDFLCEKHREELLDWLRDVGGIRLGQSGQYSQSLLQDLDDAICGDTKMGGAPIGILVSSAEEPVPFNNHASDAKHALVNTVGTWVRLFAEENPHLTLDATTLEDAARWMVQFPNLIAGHPAAVEMHADVREAVGVAHRSIDRPADRVFAGRCDLTMNGEVCDTRLMALEHRYEVVCPTCGTEYHVEDRREQIEKALRSERATAKTITDALKNFANIGINVKSIRTWARRGLIRNYAAEGETPVHEIGETLDFARSVKATVEASCAEAA